MDGPPAEAATTLREFATGMRGLSPRRADARPSSFLQHNVSVLGSPFVTACAASDRRWKSTAEAALRASTRRRRRLQEPRRSRSSWTAAGRHAGARTDRASAHRAPPRDVPRRAREPSPRRRAARGGMTRYDRDFKLLVAADVPPTRAGRAARRAQWRSGADSARDLANASRAPKRYRTPAIRRRGAGRRPRPPGGLRGMAPRGGTGPRRGPRRPRGDGESRRPRTGRRRGAAGSGHRRSASRRWGARCVRPARPRLPGADARASSRRCSARQGAPDVSAAVVASFVCSRRLRGASATARRRTPGSPALRLLRRVARIHATLGPCSARLPVAGGPRARSARLRALGYLEAFRREERPAETRGSRPGSANPLPAPPGLPPPPSWAERRRGGVRPPPRLSRRPSWTKARVPSGAFFSLKMGPRCSEAVVVARPGRGGRRGKARRGRRHGAWTAGPYGTSRTRWRWARTDDEEDGRCFGRCWRDKVDWARTIQT